MAKIFLKFNAAVITELKLEKEVTTFGRKEGNDLIINHPAVSGFHGKIVQEGTDYVVEDLNSTNGTLLNGVRVKRSKLNNKDLIRIAKHILEFVSDDNAAATPMAPEVEETPKEAAASSLSSQPVVKKETVKKEPALPAPNIPNIPETVETNSGLGGVIKIIAGGVDGQNEVQLKALVTYIGTSDQAAIKIKGLLAPSLAAALSKRPDGFFLKAVKPGYPKVNGKSVQEQVLLESGALIECGGTNMVFYAQGDKKKAS